MHALPLDWTLPWHEILHHWNERVKSLIARNGLKAWSVVCLGQYWKFAKYDSTLRNMLDELAALPTVGTQ